MRWSVLRLSFLWSVWVWGVAGPLAAQDDLAARPGRWIAAPEAAVVVEPGAAVRPDTRPVPRPGPRPWEGVAAQDVPAGVGDVAAEAVPVQEWRRPEVPLVSLGIPAIGAAAPTAQMAAVLLPVAFEASRPQQPVAGVLAPPPDPVPVVLSRPRPRGPEAFADLRPPQAPWSAPLSAAVLPQRASDVPQGPHLARVLARAMPPVADAFPVSALPPGALPEGPEAMRRADQPPAPWREAMAAVMVGAPVALRARALLPGGPAAPVRDDAPVSPEAPIRLPDPQPQALARVIDDAMACWRRADLSPEARWAEIAVDVALDAADRPAEASIRLTGFRGGVVSRAAAEADRAARGALLRCAAATGARPVTEAATLIFDRTGIRLR